MKYEKWFLILCAVAAGVLSFVPGVVRGVLGALALPFTAAGWVLRTLSLSGPIGNAAAIVVYVLICCIPLVFWWKSGRKKEDRLLVLLSGVVAYVLYYMINPGLRNAVMQNAVGDAGYAGAFWSTLVAWGILKLVGAGEGLQTRNLYRGLRWFLLLCAVSCLMSCFGSGLGELREGLAQYGSGGYVRGDVRGMTVLFLFLDFLARAAEDVLCALVLYKGAQLLTELERDPFSEGCVVMANEVSLWCRRSLAVIALVSLAMNLGQLLVSPLLMNIQLEVRIPVMGLAVSFVMLAVTRLLVRGKELQDESDLFI